MKILITGMENKGCLENSYARAFRSLGHEIVRFNDRERYEEKFNLINNKYTHRLFWRFFARSLQSDLLNVIEQENPDLVFVIKGWFFHPNTLRRIQREYPNKTLFCFNQENPFSEGFSYSNDWMVDSIPIYDAYFTWGKFLMEEIEDAGAKHVEYLPFAHDPDLHYPVNLDEQETARYTSDITFIGTWSEKREQFLRALLDCDIKIWGNLWERASQDVQSVCTGEAVYGEEFSKVVNGSKIVLDVLREQMIPSHSMKSFEIPACGGLLLCNHGGELEEFYDIGDEIVVFEGKNDLREKIGYYLNHPEDRDRLAKAGRERVQEHTYESRAETVLNVYGHIGR